MNNIWIVLFLMYAFSESNAILISLDKFPKNKSAQTEQIWNKYIYQSCAEFLNRTISFKPKSFLGFIHHHFKVSSKHYQITSQRRDTCQKSEYLYRSTVRTVVMGRVCDDFIALEEYKGGRKEPIYPPVPHSFQRLCSQSVHYVIMKASEFHVQLHQNLMLNLTVLRMDIELTYRCGIERVSKGVTRSLAAHDRICGKLPQMTYFMYYPQIFLIIDVLFDKKPGRVDLQFQVSDPQFVFPVPCEGLEWYRLVQSKCYHIGFRSTFRDATRIKEDEVFFLLGLNLKSRGTQYQIYSIHIRKFYQLILNKRSHFRKLSQFYDGPYIMDQLLVLPDKSNRFRFSSFQGTLVFTLDYAEETKYIPVIDKAVSRCTCPTNNDQKYLFVSDDKDLNLRNCRGDCSCKRSSTIYCVVLIQTKLNHYVKVSFNTIQYEGPNIDNCRFGGVTVFDGDRYITNLCGSYSQNITHQTSNKVPMDVVSTGPNLTIVIYSYLDDTKVNFTYNMESCPGIFFDPCTGVVWARTRTIDTGRFILKREDHWVRNRYVLQNCSNTRGMKIHFKTFSLTPAAPCATIQIHTPQWQYDSFYGKFYHHCQLVLYQNHSQKEYRLQYNIKSFQHSSVVIMPHDMKGKYVNKPYPCDSLHRRVVYRELPSYGDMIAYNFIEGKIHTQHHSIINQRCPKRNDHIKTLQVQECNVQILSKPYNSSMVSYFSVTEIPMKIPAPLSVPGTVSVRLRAWEASWASLKVTLVCHLPNANTQLDNVCNYAKLTSCIKVARDAETHLERNSVLKLSINQGTIKDSNCYLGKLKVKLKFKEFCIETEHDNTAISVTTDLMTSMFLNNYYYFHVPMDYEPYYPVLSYDHQTEYKSNTTVNSSCQDTDINFSWHAIKIPQSKLRYRDIDRCLLYDYGDRVVMLKELKVLETKWQQEADASLLESQQNKTITSEKTYHTLWSDKVNVTNLKDFTWENADSFCKQRGSHLITIHSISDLKDLIQFLFEFIYEERVPFYTIYVGIQRKGQQNILKHADNKSLAYQLWLNQQYGTVKRHHRISEIIRLSETNSQLKKLLKLPNVTHMSNIEMMLENITDLLQPELSTERKCSMLLFNNMLHPETIMIDCKTNYVKNRVVCRKHTNRNLVIPQNALYCPPDTLHVSYWCYKAFYKTKEASIHCTDSLLWDLGLDLKLQSILETMTILQGKNITFVSMIDKKRGREICNTLTYSYSPLYIFESLNWRRAFNHLCDEVSGIYLCTSFSKPFTQNSVDLLNLFSCDNGIYISSIFLCDNINQCQDSSDEIFCTTLKTSNANLNETIKNCKANDRTPDTVYQTCLMWSDENGTYRTYAKVTKSVTEMSHFLDTKISNAYKKYQWSDTSERTMKTEYFMCSDGANIPFAFVNDTIPDCMDGDDELEYKSLLISENNKKCEDPAMIPCVPGHSKCFNISNMCLYQRHPVYHNLEFCRNGAHLAECEMLDCNDNFKCPGYYCIHIGHRCDGVRDCPNGEDEVKCNDYNCIGKYKCNNSRKCIHIRDFCDNMIHCVHGDDEMTCDIKTCWPNCFCLNYAIHCVQLEVTHLLKRNYFSYVHVSIERTVLLDIPMLKLNNFFTKFNQSMFLYLKDNNILSVCPNYFQTKSLLIKLSITNNKLKELQKGCFSMLGYLNQLSLKENVLDNIKGDSFLNLSRLTSLDLSNNKLTTLNSKSFNDLDKLSFLNILNNPLQVLDTTLFEKSFLSIKQIQTEDFRICCLQKRPTVTCNADIPWPSSCSNILERKNLRHSMLGIAIGVFCLNILSTLHHLRSMMGRERSNPNLKSKKRDRKIGYNSIVILINISDVFLSIYLMVLVRTDYKYEGHFSSFERSWRKSPSCHFLSFVFIFSSLLSLFSMTLLAVTRNRMITNPMNTTFSKKSTILRLLALGVISSFLISTTVMISYIFLEGNTSQSNALCLLIGNLGNSITIKSTTVIFAVVEFCGIIANITLYVHLLNSLFRQKKELAEVSGKGGSTVKISTVIQLLTVGITNILCWAPGGILNILSLAVEGYSIEALLWITTLATPLNGIVNPIVFNYSLMTKVWKKVQKLIIKPEE